MLDEGAPLARRDRAAAEALPFCHPRLAVSEVRAQHSHEHVVILPQAFPATPEGSRQWLEHAKAGRTIDATPTPAVIDAKPEPMKTKPTEPDHSVPLSVRVAMMKQQW
jgi:hypothetical protein